MFDSLFEINTLKEQLQGQDNTIRNLKVQVSKLKEKHNETDHAVDNKTLESQNIELTKDVTALQAQNELFRAENATIKQHYKDLYDSIKKTRASTFEKTSSFLTEIEKLKA